MIKTDINANDYADGGGTLLSSLLDNGVIPRFVRKKDARQFAKEIGWRLYLVLRVDRVFAVYWCVGQCISNEAYGKYRFPTGKWEKDSRGIQIQECAEVSKRTSNRE